MILLSSHNVVLPASFCYCFFFLSMMADNLMVHIGAIPIGSHGCFHNSWWADSMVHSVSIRTLAGTGHNGLLDAFSHTLEEVGAVSTASTVLLLGHDVVVVLVVVVLMDV